MHLSDYGLLAGNTVGDKLGDKLSDKLGIAIRHRPEYNAGLMRGGAVWQLVGLITRRS